MLLCVSVFIFFLYFLNTDFVLHIVGTFAAALVLAIWLILSQRRKGPGAFADPGIKKFVLMSPDGENEMEWHCEGAKSMLIGKGSGAADVDIDLASTQYCEYISNEHAALNCSDGFWYIEDLESLNGVGIRKRGDSFALRLKPLVSYKIDEGDVIYISKAKILVR